MRYTYLNNMDLRVSQICLGTAEFGSSLNKQRAFDILDEFVYWGGNFIDTANIYGKWLSNKVNCSERIIGEWIKERRNYDSIVVITKGGHYCFDDINKSRINQDNIGKDIKESLKSLNIDCIPLYLLHRDDKNKPIEEIIEILLHYQKLGMIRYFGLSNYSVDRLETARKYLYSKSRNNKLVVSNYWSFANKNDVIFEDKTLVTMNSYEYQWHCFYNIPLLPYSAAAQGFYDKLYKSGLVVKDGEIISFGKVFTQVPSKMMELYWNKENLKKYEFLVNLHKCTGNSIHTLSIAQLLQQPFQVIPICSAYNKNQLSEIMKIDTVKFEKYKWEIGK